VSAIETREFVTGASLKPNRKEGRAVAVIDLLA
jgi:hypothetical protein